MITIQITDGKDNIVSEDQICVGKSDILVFQITDSNLSQQTIEKNIKNLKENYQQIFNKKNTNPTSIILPHYISLKVLKISDE